MNFYMHARQIDWVNRFALKPAMDGWDLGPGLRGEKMNELSTEIRLSLRQCI